MARSKIIDRDHGWRAFKRTVDVLNREKPRIAVGIVADQNPQHNKATGETVADVAARNEFGLGTPERSFLRSNWDAKRPEYERYVGRGIRREVLAAAQNSQPVTTDSSVTLKRLALKIEGDVKAKIASFVPPPNAPSTVRAKKSSKPLIWSGQMRRAVTSQIRKAGQ